MRVAYLDQNQWIQLARAQHGRLDDVPLLQALTFLRRATASEELALPLSAVHHIEAARKANTPARIRLGIVMWELSRGRTIASYKAILTHELETALAKRFPHVRPQPFTLVSRGVAHAFGMEPRPYQIPAELRKTLPGHVVRRLETVGNSFIERALVTGEVPPGEKAPVFGITDHNRRFQEHLRTLRSRLSQLPSDKWDDALYAISIVDILDTLNEVIGRHDLYASQVASDREQLRSLVDDLPSRRVDLHLHRQVLRNPALEPKENDLEDWGGLAPAATHCDFLVCEKHFASLLLRDGFLPKAKVLTDVRDLPAALGNEAAA